MVVSGAGGVAGAVCSGGGVVVGAVGAAGAVVLGAGVAGALVWGAGAGVVVSLVVGWAGSPGVWVLLGKKMK